jgi:hypothetical protein
MEFETTLVVYPTSPLSNSPMRKASRLAITKVHLLQRLVRCRNYLCKMWMLARIELAARNFVKRSCPFTHLEAP